MKYSALLLALAPVFAFAQSAVNFEGEVTNLTCNVSINGTAAPTIALNPARASLLSTAGNTAVPTPFTMKLTGCESAAANIKLVPNAYTTGGNLKNVLTSGQAANVHMQLYQGSTALLMTSPAGVSIPVTITGGTGESVLGVRYVAEGGVGGEGMVKATVQYAVSYL